MNFPHSLSVDQKSALSNSHTVDSSDDALLSSEILVGVVVGGCVLVLVAALAVGAVCYKQKNTPDKRTLVHAASIGEIEEWMDNEWMGKCMDEWMDRWINEWMK